MREIQIRTIMRCHSHQAEWLKLTSQETTKIGEDAEKGNLLTLFMGMQADTATLESSMEVPQKLKIELPYNPATALLGIYPKDTDVVKRRGTCTPMFIAAMSTIAKLWKELRCHQQTNE